MAFCKAEDGLIRNMNIIGKWIHVDTQFEEKYPELYKKITQLSEYVQYNGKVEAGISKSGNIKLLWNSDYQTILFKNDLESKLLQQEYVRYSIDFGKQMSTDNVSRNEWRVWFDISKIEMNILPQLKSQIRQKLAKEKWEFELSIQITGKKKNVLCLLQLKASEFSSPLEKQLSSLRLSMYNNLDAARSYFEEVTEELIEEIKKIQATNRRQQMKDFIRDHWEEIGKHAQECISTYFKQLDNTLIGVLHYNKYESNVVYFTVSYLGMMFRCEEFSQGQSIASFFRETTGLASYRTITKLDNQLMDLVVIDLKSAMCMKTEKFKEKLKKAVIDGLELDLSTSPVSYQTELQDKIEEYNQWKRAWLDGYRQDMKIEINGTLYAHQHKVVLENEAGSITVNSHGAKYTASEQFKEYQTLKNAKLRERCRQFALEMFSECGHIECEKKSIGILNGDTKLTIKMDKTPSFSYQYKTVSYQKSVTEWKKTLNKNKKEIKILAEATRKTRKEELQKQYKSYLDSYLVRDIFDCVAANETYITQNAVVQILRGTKVSLDTHILPSHGDGLYRLYRAEEVSDEITKSIHSGLLTPVGIKGTYGWFDVLRIAGKTKQEHKELITLMGEELNQWTKEKQAQIRKKLRCNATISDAEAEQYLIYGILKNEEKDSSIYMDLINLVSHPIILVLHEADIRKYFADAPEPIVKFLKLHYKESNIQEKRILKHFFLFDKERTREKIK